LEESKAERTTEDGREAKGLEGDDGVRWICDITPPNCGNAFL